MKHLVLIGGGHAHAIALRWFSKQPVTGARITLLTATAETAYSGMLPGHVAGFYRKEDCHIHLSPLAQAAGAHLELDQAIGLDLATRQVLCATRPPLEFDLLSINIGSTPSLPTKLQHRDILPVKPIPNFLHRWDQLVSQVNQQPDRPISLAIVGGGAGGVELALTMHHRLQHCFAQAGQPCSNLAVHLIHRGSALLPQYPPWVGDRFYALLSQRQIQVHLNEEIQSIQAHSLRCKSGLQLVCDPLVWVTQASAPSWLRSAGLAVDPQGFIQVNEALQSISHPEVFAAGDVATMVNHPRPKAGVFAVRQGKPLFQNLSRAVAGQPLQPFYPQKHYLSLIGTGDQNAVAVWGALSWRSPLLWRLKDSIDRRFMAQFRLEEP